METKVRVFGKAQNRIALGIINAYLNINPNSRLADLQKAFPDSINPDCGSKKIFMPEADINEHIARGEAWYASARGYFVKDDEWLILPDGERIGFVSMWSRPSFERLVAKASEYGIVAEMSNEKTGTYRLEYINGANLGNKDSNNVIDNLKKTAGNIIETTSSVLGGITKSIGEKISTLKKDTSEIDTVLSENQRESEMSNAEEVETRTYHLRIEGDLFHRVDIVELPNADDDEIEEGFDDGDGWTDLVGETSLLDTRLEDFDNAIEDDDYGYVGDDEDGVKRIMAMIDDCSVSDGIYYPDAGEEFRIVVMDEDEEEIEIIEGADIQAITFEEGYRYGVDEDDDLYQFKIDYLKKNNLEQDDICNDFCMNVEGWSWINVQNCEMDECPVYELEIQGEFDASKLSVKKVLVEESVNGLMSFEAITRIIYDGKELTEYESGCTLNEDGTNYFVKREDKDEFPSVVYDFTNKEKN